LSRNTKNFAWIYFPQGSIFFKVKTQQQSDKGMSLIAASLHAAKLRFRPTVMTSLAFTLSVFPLVVSQGAGSAARQSMGTGVFGGMLVATFVATIFVPLFFLMLSSRKTQVDRE
jgi:multidrug efflux pump subunit AcrB